MPSSTRVDRLCLAVIRLLREERERQGLSGKALAAKAGLNQSTMSLMDRGLRHPTLDTLWRLAEALGVAAGEILLQAEREVAGERPDRTAGRVKLKR